MGKLQEFLLKEKLDSAVETEVVVSKRFVEEDGTPIPFKVRSISEAQNKAIRKDCQRTSYNKKTRQKETDTDTDLYMNRLVIACTAEPNFKDAELQTLYGVVGAEALLNALLNPGEYAELLQAIQTINGFDTDINELVDEAKN